MRIIMMAHGSTGDVLPLIALATELQTNGHQLHFLLPTDLLPYAQQYGFETTQLGPDIHETFEHFQRLYSQRTLTKQNGSHYYHSLLASAPYALQQLSTICHTADLLISSDVSPLGFIAYEITGIPFISVRFRYLPLPYEGQSRIQLPSDGWENLLNKYREQLGLKAIVDQMEPYGISPQLILFPVSRVFLPPSTRLQKRYHVTGFFFLPREEWEPEPQLAAFLSDGAPPLVITLGSMRHDDPTHITKILMQAIEVSGCRAIIQRGWSGLARNVALPPTIYATEFIPHISLFNRVAGILHHGGIGTTAAALYAGLPMIVLPHTMDNLAIARRVKSLGIASHSIPLQMLSVDELSAAITNLYTNTCYQTTASLLSQHIQAEQGVQTASHLIEQFMYSLPLTK